MRWVLDTNVVASALLWSGNPGKLLYAARSGDASIYTSAPLLIELIEILGRRKFALKVEASGMSISALVECYASVARVVRPARTERIAPDPDDDVVIGTAIAARSNYIVTGDRALLSVCEHRGIRIVSVSAAIESITTR